MVRYNVSLYISAFLLMFGIGMIVALLPQKMIHLSGSVAQVGYIASAFALTFVLIQIPMGRLSDNWGFKPFLVIGYLTCAGSGVLYYFSNDVLPILLGRMLQGIGEVPLWSLAPALLALQHPRHKGKAIGLYNAAIHSGLTAGSLAGIWTAGIWQGNQAFLLFTSTGVVGALIIALFVKAPVRTGRSCQSRTQGSLISFLGSPGNPVVFTGILLYGAGYSIFITMIPGFLLSTRGCDQGDISLVFMLFYVAVSFSQAIAGPISDRQGRKPVMMAGLGAAALGMAVFPVLPLAWMLALLTLSALGLGTFCVSALALLNEGVSDSMKGTVSGCFYLFWGVGYFSGPLVMGFCGEPAQWQAGFLLLGGFLAAETLACGCLLRRPERQVRRIEEPLL